jgi:hypothetical protein
MKRKKGLSLEQHQQLAAELLAMHEKTRQILHQICNAYGVSKRICKRAPRLMNEVSDF